MKMNESNRRICIFASLFTLCSSQQIRFSTAEETTCENRPPPSVRIGGVATLVNGDNFPHHHGSFPPGRMAKESEINYFILNESKSVLYVSNFLNSTISNELKDFCISGNRFTRSPIRGYGNTPGVTESSTRTSESCTLVPASIYLANARYLEMIQADPLPAQVAKIAREVDVSWDIAIRASQLLNVEPETVESLQLVRYTTPLAEYQLHHDHGGFYGKDTEHRTWTMLIFLNDVSAGGSTAFPKLDLEVTPRAGDALVWSNVNDDGDVDADMVHMGRPPANEGVEKYAINVWFGGESLSKRKKELNQW